MLLLMGEVTILFVVVAAYELYAGILGVYAVLIGENIIFVEAFLKHKVVDVLLVVEAVDDGLNLRLGAADATHVVEHVHHTPNTCKHRCHIYVWANTHPQRWLDLWSKNRFGKRLHHLLVEIGEIVFGNFEARVFAQFR